MRIPIYGDETTIPSVTYSVVKEIFADVIVKEMFSKFQIITKSVTT